MFHVNFAKTQSPKLAVKWNVLETCDSNISSSVF